MSKDAPIHSLPAAPELATAKVLLSTGRSATLRELTGRAQLHCDSCAGDGALMSTIYYRAVGSLEEVDGHKLAPVAGKADLDLIMDRLTGRELDDLVRAYSENFGTKGPDLGNALSAEA